MIGIAEAVVHEVCTQQAVIDAAQALNSLRMMIITEQTEIAWLEAKMVDDCCMPLLDRYTAANMPQLLDMCEADVAEDVESLWALEGFMTRFPDFDDFDMWVMQCYEAARDPLTWSFGCFPLSGSVEEQPSGVADEDKVQYPDECRLLLPEIQPARWTLLNYAVDQMDCNTYDYYLN